MWNRGKREDEIPARPTTTAPAAQESSREAIPMNTYATRGNEYGATRATATIGKTLVVKGSIQGKEDLVIDGRLDGDVELPEHRLTVGQTGHVQGGIKAREIVVMGSVQGNLEASERVEIKRNARVVGDLRAQRPVIEDEAYFKGSVETIRVDAPKQQAKAAVANGGAEAQASLLKETAEKPEIRRG